MEVHLRFGMHRDVGIIHEKLDKIDGLVIPAHILSYQSAPTSVFVSSMPPSKSYAIDPMTFVFQNSKESYLNEGGEIRLSLKALFESYHKNLLTIISGLPNEANLTPSDFPDVDEFCANVSTFQRRQVYEASKSSRAGKYLERYKETQARSPRVIIPPYFRFNQIADVWYQFSLRCAGTVAGLENDIPISPVIFCNLSALTTVGIKKIVSDYSQFGQVFIWIDDYNQTRVSSQDITKVRKLINSLTKAGLRVETLYGGYLMILSKFDGLQGISHGILYTQHKSMEMTPGSGGPAERYYLPALREFRSLSQTDLIIHMHPEIICNCEVCEPLLQNNPDNLILYRDNPELLRGHFLAVRRDETSQIELSSIKSEIETLKTTVSKYNESISTLPNPDAFISFTHMRGLEYLRQWIDAFSEAKEE